MKELNYIEIAERLKNRRLQMNYSYQELADKVGMSKSTLQRYETGTIKNIPIARLKSLSAALDMDPNELIGIKGEGRTFPAKNLLPPPETYQVPRLGQIACGAPILAEQNIESYDSVPVAIRCDFTLLCKGDSMIGAGLEDGDIVYIREQPEVETGEIAAVMVGEDEATLKRFKRVGNTILLIPENSNYEPLVFSGGEMNGVRILGKAVGFTRQFEK